MIFWVLSPSSITVKMKENESGEYAIGPFVLAYSTEINATLLDKISLRCNPFHLFLFSRIISRWFYSLYTRCVTIDMLMRSLSLYCFINLTTILTAKAYYIYLYFCTAISVNNGFIRKQVLMMYYLLLVLPFKLLFFFYT